MGMSIVMHEYVYDRLCEDIHELSYSEGVPADRTADYFIAKILPNFGVRSGEFFITLWNDYYENYNSGVEVMLAADLYFGLSGTFLDGYESVRGVNAYEVLEELGIEPIEVD